MGGEGWRALKGSRQRPPGAWRLGVTRCAYAQAQTMAIRNIWEDPIPLALHRKATTALTLKRYATFALSIISYGSSYGFPYPLRTQ
jgi:hypothetical protein